MAELTVEQHNFLVELIDICRKNPRAKNPTEYGVCVYNGEGVRTNHCVIGQWFADKGIEIHDSRNADSAFTLFGDIPTVPYHFHTFAQHAQNLADGDGELGPDPVMWGEVAQELKKKYFDLEVWDSPPQKKLV